MLEDLLELITSILGHIISTTSALACHVHYRLAWPSIPGSLSIGIPSQQFSLLKRTLDEHPAYSYGWDAFILAPVPVRV